MASKIIIKQPEQQGTEKPGMDSPEQKKQEEVVQEEPQKPMQISLKIRKGLDGRLVIFDHDHIDIVFLPEKNKLISLAKQDYSDIVYETQERLFDFLVSKGLCAPESVRGSNVYGAIEAQILQAKDDIPAQHLLMMNIEKWIESEKPALQMDKEYEESFNSIMTSPDEEESTRLGEVPQEEDKGSIPRYASRRYIGGWW